MFVIKKCHNLQSLLYFCMFLLPGFVPLTLRMRGYLYYIFVGGFCVSCYPEDVWLCSHNMFSVTDAQLTQYLAHL